MAVKKKTYDFRCRTLADVSGARRMRRPRSWRTEIARSGTAMSETRSDAYGYNDRNELVSASKLGGSQSPAAEYAYQYDDIGNRITSTDLGTNRTYTANFLNQYTLISNLCDSVTLCEEEECQGSINHALDSITDIVANVLGVSLESLGIDPRTVAEIGDWIPGPGEPDPAFNHGNDVPNYQQTGNPSGAWGYGPSTR